MAFFDAFMWVALLDLVITILMKLNTSFVKNELGALELDNPFNDMATNFNNWGQRLASTFNGVFAFLAILIFTGKLLAVFSAAWAWFLLSLVIEIVGVGILHYRTYTRLDSWALNFLTVVKMLISVYITLHYCFHFTFSL